MRVVLISGAQGSGKTSLQKSLAAACFQRLKWRVETINFADVIYKIHDYSLNVLADHGIPKTDKKDGRLLQLLGTEWARNTLGQNIWVQCAQNKADELNAKFHVDLLIIGDARFENEFDGFPEALRIRLEAPEDIRKERCESWREDTKHPSEVGLNKYSDEGRFDMYFRTDLLTTEQITELVIAQLVKNNWKEKRGQCGVEV